MIPSGELDEPVSSYHYLPILCLVTGKGLPWPLAAGACPHRFEQHNHLKGAR
jgi:hypothetical protein